MTKLEQCLKQVEWFCPPLKPRQPSQVLDATVSRPNFRTSGLQLLRDGRVAVLMVAGGLSTRLGSDRLRGDLPIGPVTDRTIFRLQGEKIAAIKQRYSPDMPWLVMTSDMVHRATLEVFEREGFFGVPSEDVWFFCQALLPVFDSNQQVIPLPEGGVLQCPTGHGGMLESLDLAGFLGRLRQRGIDYLFYFQYPNVLEKICDPVMLGYHHSQRLEITTKAINKYRPEEKMGRIAEVDGKPRVVEYHFLDRMSPNSPWHTLPASIATHVWSISFLERCLFEHYCLPYHIVPHHVSKHTDTPLYKLEQFVFDLMALSKTSGIVIVERDDEYAPVKTLRGADSLDAAQRALSHLYQRWLMLAGAKSQGKVHKVEISPLWALFADDVKDRLPHGFEYDEGLVLAAETQK